MYNIDKELNQTDNKSRPTFVGLSFLSLKVYNKLGEYR